MCVVKWSFWTLQKSVCKLNLSESNLRQLTAPVQKKESASSGSRGWRKLKIHYVGKFYIRFIMEFDMSMALFYFWGSFCKSLAASELF